MGQSPAAIYPPRVALVQETGPYAAQGLKVVALDDGGGESMLYVQGLRKFSLLRLVWGNFLFLA